MKRLIVDLSSLAWACLFAGKDEEFGYTVTMPNGRNVYVNTAMHGYENALNSITAAWEKNGITPMNTILVEEGHNSTSLRKDLLPTYKEGRDSNRPDEYLNEFNKLKNQLIELVLALGGRSVTRKGMEADDVIAFLAQRLQGKKVILTNDADLAALINEDTILWRKGEALTTNPYGPFDVKYLPVYKALVGDTSDKIPGAKGFGDKAFLNVLTMFGEGGLDEIERLINLTDEKGRTLKGEGLKELEANVADLKVISKVIEHRQTVYASYQAGRLYPEMVEDVKNPLQWRAGFTGIPEDYRPEFDKYVQRPLSVVDAGNYESMFKVVEKFVKQSPFVALDIETTVPKESIEWLMALKGTDKEDKLGVDVLGSQLVGLALTFGRNANYTLYFSVKHKDTNNLTPAQVLEVIKLVPQDKPIVVHNSNFEQPVLFNTWGKDWHDNGWHGFLPNVHDTAVLANYVNENMPVGLKSLSKHYFDYDQTTYQEVTQGRKMDEITAKETLAYGADDTIMTAALYNHFKVICELEGSWNAYKEIEVKPAYVTALAFTQGTPVDIEALSEYAQADEARAEELQAIIDRFLIAKGWEGTVCPVYTNEDLEVPAKIKEMFLHFTGEPLKTMVRTPEKIFKLIEVGIDLSPESSQTQEDFDSSCRLFANLAVTGNLDEINAHISNKFDGKPKFDVSSPKQMQHLLYHVINTPVRIVNKLTDKQRGDNPKLAHAVYRFNKINRGSVLTEPLTDEEKELLKMKASTDDTAVAFALLEEDLAPDAREFLEALSELKTINTLFSMFYKPYANVQHWDTNRVHAQVRLTSTVTRRTTSSSPNLQQLPKRGAGTKFRRIFLPHIPTGYVVSIDYNAQEIRAQAEYSQDPTLLSCYVGDHLQDLHAITASQMMAFVWGDVYVAELAERLNVPESNSYDYDLIIAALESDDKDISSKAKALRNMAKPVNFGSSYGITAPKMSQELLSSVEEAENYLQAKKEAFPGYEEWKAHVEDEAGYKGYVQLKSGARRHLDNVTSGNSWEVDRAKRQASNYWIQGSCAEQTKLAMGRLWDSGALFKYDAQFIAPIHDELVCSVAPQDAADFIKVMHDCMVVPFFDTVPVVAEISMGPSFGEQIEIGPEASNVLINDVAKQITNARGY